MKEDFVYAVVFLATCLISNYPAAIFAFAFVHLIYKTSIKEYWLSMKFKYLMQTYFI